LSWSRCCRGSSCCCCCRRGSSRCGGRSRGCWGWRRTWDASRGLDNYPNWRTSLKEAYCRIRRIGPLVGVKPEVIQRAPSNRIGILISRKSFRAPGNGACVLANIPRSAAVTGISDRSIMCPTGMLRRRVKFNVSDIYSSAHRHAERLNRAVEVHVKESILIMPDASRWVGYLVTHKPDAIVSWGWTNLVHCRACSYPSLDGRLHSRCASRRCKSESVRTAANRKRAIGEIVEHVALIRMRLTPGKFMRGNVRSFAEILYA
jgi:hypothetical protein